MRRRFKISRHNLLCLHLLTLMTQQIATVSPIYQCVIRTGHLKKYTLMKEQGLTTLGERSQCKINDLIQELIKKRNYSPLAKVDFVICSFLCV